ncbi:MAG: copper homeostasis protein CutC [Clostridiales bacterium]|jgi:copper homeostasis protein|nr:copper homeostasis protein CutC [Clostridiales bacterium]
MGKITVEICCGSVDDAVLSYKSGADRIEFNTALSLGGLTSSLGMFKVARRLCQIPIMCMVRPRDGGFFYTDFDFESMLSDARAFMDAGADGLVFGFLDKEGNIDTERTKRMVEIAGEESVFHKAFDVHLERQGKNLETLISCGIKRVLTSGGKKTAEEGIPNLKALMDQAKGRIEILPGGGVRDNNAIKIIKETGCDQLHRTCHKDCIDYSMLESSHMDFTSSGVPKEAVFPIVDSEAVKNFLNLLKNTQ